MILVETWIFLILRWHPLKCKPGKNKTEYRGELEVKVSKTTNQDFDHMWCKSSFLWGWKLILMITITIRWSWGSQWRRARRWATPRQTSPRRTRARWPPSQRWLKSSTWRPWWPGWWVGWRAGWWSDSGWLIDYERRLWATLAVLWPPSQARRRRI